MLASTWIALFSCAVLVVASAIGAEALREKFQEDDPGTDHTKRTVCGFYKAYNMGMLGFFMAFGNALLLEHLQDPDKRQAAAAVIDSVANKEFDREAIEDIVMYLAQHASHPKAKKALEAAQFMGVVHKQLDQLDC